MSKENYEVHPIPRGRTFSLDAGRLGRQKHIVHGLAEVDVTQARELIQDHKAATGERFSFTAFIIYCLGQAIDHHPALHAYRDWRGHLIIFEDVNITSMIEIEIEGQKVPAPHVFKAVNKKSYRELNDEIRTTQTNPPASDEVKFMKWFLYLPWLLRRPFYWLVQRFPQSFRAYSSPVMVTAVGMFSRGASWAITMPNFTLTVALGGIVVRPGYVDGQIQPREYLHVTISVDHDIVDGAPIARFGSELMELVESAAGLREVIFTSNTAQT